MNTTTNHSTESTSSTTTNRREEKLAEARAVLEQGLSDVREDPEALAAYLRFRSCFREYSVQNTMLIMLQRPTAQYCKGYRAWLQHGRQVRKGEKGLMIYAPILRRPTEEEIAGGADPDERIVSGFRVTHTFDYAQTDAVRDDALVYESPAPRLNREGYDGLAERLIATAASIGYVVEELPQGLAGGGYADGSCNFRTQTIKLAAGLSSADRAAVLAHELAHAIAHGDGRKTGAVERELQAEGAAYVALNTLGLDTSRASLPYLKGWAGDDAALLSELAAIDRIATELLDRVDALS
jgi:antirestriction protein ArdC